MAEENKKENEPAPQKQEQHKHDKMKGGQYLVHVFLQQARGLVPDQQGETIDPIITISILGTTKHSTARDDISAGAAIYWGQHFFFTYDNLDLRQAENAKILVQIRNHRMLLSDSLIGVYQMDLSYIYFREKHALIHQWIALYNPDSEDFQKIRGHLKLGICVQCEGDQDVDLSVKEKDEGKDMQVLLPPHVTHQSVQLVVRVMKAQGLPKLDGWGGTIDAFASAEFGGAKIESTVVKADQKHFGVFWYQDLYLPVTVPPVSSTLMVRIWDQDKVSSNDLVGTMTFLWTEIAEGQFQDYFWHNLYGSNKDIENEQADLQDQFPDLATNWRGRVLMSIRIQNPKKPCIDKKKIQDPNIAEFYRDHFQNSTPYQIRIQISAGHSLPDVSSKYKIMVSWCGKFGMTKQKKCENGCVGWYEMLKRKIAKIPGYYDNALPDIFVYLQDDDEKNVAFARLDPYAWMDPTLQQKWVMVVPDKAVGQIKNDWDVGYVQIRLFIGVFNQQQENLAVGRWNIPPRKKRGQKLTLIANLYQCRNLPAADSTGTSDPYVTVYCGGKTAKSNKKQNTLNPMWYQTLVLDLTGLSLQQDPPLIVQIFDHDTISSDDLIGMIRTNLSAAYQNHPYAGKPKWRKLNLGKSECGEILISFNVYKDKEEVVQYSIVPECMDVMVEINSLGLRNLAPALGWVPIHKAFIKFDMNSLQIPGQHLIIRNIQTQPAQSGANPNINTVIKFECKMAVDELFSPVLTCIVYDYLFKGLAQPQIGTFSINLGEIMHAHKRKKGWDFGKNKTKGGKSQEKKKKKLVEKIQPGRPSIEQARKGAFVCYPEYVVDRKGRMIEKQMDNQNYIGLGYDRKQGDQIKHYRFLLDCDLQDTEYIDKSPFQHFELQRGQQFGVQDNFFSLILSNKDKKGNPTTLKNVGQFKGMVRVTQISTLQAKQKKIQDIKKRRENIQKNVKEGKGLQIGDIANVISPKLSDLVQDNKDQDFDDTRKLLLKKTHIVVRIYIIQCKNLMQKDRLSHSDPYIRLKLEDQVINDSDNFIQNQPNPVFCKSFDMKAVLPGPSKLKIQIWDKDPIVTDDKIGQTIIDLQDRYFSNKWRRLTQVPVQTRHLYVPSSKISQGTILMWLQIFDPSQVQPPFDISPRPPSEFEVRIIVWRTLDIANYDVQSTSDIYIRLWINDCDPKQTDTHFRCQNGKAYFNWRMKFPLHLPFDHNICNLQIWDRDILSANDFIGDISFGFNQLAKKVFQTEKRAKLELEEQKGLLSKPNQHEKDRVWLTCTRRTDEGEDQQVGKVQITFEIVPKSGAETCPVGEGRDEPNIDPYLPPPIGRFKWTWNPCSLIAQTCGPEFRAKICCAICCVICLYLCVMIGPMLFASAMGSLAQDST